MLGYGFNVGVRRYTRHGLLALLAIFASGLFSSPSARAHEVLDGARQIVVVITTDWNGVSGMLLRFERRGSHDEWSPAGQPFPIVVGKTGMAWGSGLIPAGQLGAAAGDPVKREGDGKAPAGVFALGTAFGYEPQALTGSRLPYLHLTASVECVDDAKSRYYNRIVDRQNLSAPDWNSSEHMLRDDELYHWGIAVDHNVNPIRPAGGSCIFMHIWRGAGQGTVGCTAMPKEDILQLMEWFDPAQSPLLVQMPRSQYDKLREHLKLPRLLVVD